MRVYLIGYMASGKSWLGKELAASTGYDFIDLDMLFESRFRISILDFFAKYGEPLFRKFERQLLQESSGIEHGIVSTGGGTPCYFDNMDFILSSGTSIYLRMTVEELVKRMSSVKKKRPLLKNIPPEEITDFVKDQLAEREPYYMRAKHIFDGPEYPVEEIVELVARE